MTTRASPAASSAPPRAESPHTKDIPMGFLDDLKKGANDLGSSISGSVNSTSGPQRVANLLHDLGALTWAAKTGQGGPDDSEEWARIEAELNQLAADGTAIDVKLKTAAAPPPPPPAAATPAPPAPPAPDAAAPPAPAAPAPLPQPPTRPRLRRLPRLRQPRRLLRPRPPPAVRSPSTTCSARGQPLHTRPGRCPIRCRGRGSCRGRATRRVTGPDPRRRAGPAARPARRCAGCGWCPARFGRPR